MKTVKNGLWALALVFAVSGAFVTKIKAAPKAAATTYEWQKFNRDGSRDPSMDEDATVAQAELDYGCSGTAPLCAQGTKDPGSGSGPNTDSIFFN